MIAARIQAGLPESLRHQAAALYWQAFADKLGRVLGPEPKALAYLARVIRPDHAFVAIDETGALMGLAAFKTPRGAFASGDRSDLAAIHGPLGGLWRSTALAMLQTDTDNARFLLDGLCVAQAAQGLGIGTALLDAICVEGLRRGYSAVRLEVVDTNPRARALYARAGFVEAETHRLGLLRHLFGFTAATTMVRPLP